MPPNGPFPYRTLDSVEWKGKRLLARIDINSPVEEGKARMSRRIQEHARTLQEFSKARARTVLLAHQGRPGDDDFTTLEQHARLLSEASGLPVGYVNDVIGERAKEAIGKMKPGEILLLENVRTVPGETDTRTPEEHARGPLVRALAPGADLYVNDAFPTSHRAHASVVGFSAVLPSVAGRLMERELRSLEKVRHPERPSLFLLGGAKPADSFRVMKHLVKEKLVDKVLTCGVVGNIFLWARAFQGSPFESFYDDAQLLALWAEVPMDVAIEKEGERIEIPADDVRAEHRAWDIGERTIARYKEEIGRARTIVVSGPAGKYEAPAFSKGTKELFRAVARSSAYSVVGGGDSVTALESLGLSVESFSYVSLGGHALLDFLTGAKLPGVEILRA
jgi:phosphoglycerate kinase